MKELVGILAKALVDRPDQVVVNLVEKEDVSIIKLKVAPEDMGKVIGKHGRIAKAMRTVVKAAATKKRERVIVEIDSLMAAE